MSGAGDSRPIGEGEVCLTVFFDGQFWVGIFEEKRGGALTVSRHVFGAEPSDIQILDLVQQTAHGSMNRVEGMSGAEPAANRAAHVNPKRLAREAARAIAQRGISTRSQEAIQRQREEMKSEARTVSREQREAEREHQREIARLKALKRHQGH
jgi:hypothetical protein